MDDYGVSMGVPNAGKVEGVGERTFKNKPEDDKKKKKKQEKRSLISKPDEVIISHPELTDSAAGTKTDKEKNEEKQSPDESIGHIIDVKI